MSTKAGSVIVLLFFGVLVGRCSVEPEVIQAAPPPPEVITKTEVVKEVEYKDRRVEVPVEVPVKVQVWPDNCSEVINYATAAYDSLSDYDATVGRIDRLLEEMNLGILDASVPAIVKAEEELRLTHNDSLETSQALADNRVQLERYIRLCNRDLGE